MGMGDGVRMGAEHHRVITAIPRAESVPTPWLTRARPWDPLQVVDKAEGADTLFFPPGPSVGVSLETWLQYANTSLSALNDIAGRDQLGRLDANGEARMPHYRMTGMVLTVLIDYSNGKPSFLKEKKEVRARTSPWSACTCARLGTGRVALGGRPVTPRRMRPLWPLIAHHCPP